MRARRGSSITVRSLKTKEDDKKKAEPVRTAFRGEFSVEESDSLSEPGVVGLGRCASLPDFLNNFIIIMFSHYCIWDMFHINGMKVG